MAPPLLDLRRAKIQIGGQLTRIMRERLLEAILKDGAGPRHRVYFASTAELEAHIDAAIKAGKPIELVDHRAKNGQFATIEETCRQNRLPFRRQSYARARHEGEIVTFTGAAMGKAPASQAGRPYATLDEILTAGKNKALPALVERLKAATLAVPPLSAL